MTLTDRAPAYSPAEGLAQNFPSWWVTAADLSGVDYSHMVCWTGSRKAFVVDPDDFCGDREWAFAHCLVHLELHMGHLSHLTEEDCRMADDIAMIRLDRPDDRPDCGNRRKMTVTFSEDDFPMDGDPTERM